MATNESYALGIQSNLIYTVLSGKFLGGSIILNSSIQNTNFIKDVEEKAIKKYNEFINLHPEYKSYKLEYNRYFDDEKLLVFDPFNFYTYRLLSYNDCYIGYSVHSDASPENYFIHLSNTTRVHQLKIDGRVAKVSREQIKKKKKLLYWFIDYNLKLSIDFLYKVLYLEIVLNDITFTSDCAIKKYTSWIGESTDLLIDLVKIINSYLFGI